MRILALIFILSSVSSLASEPEDTLLEKLFTEGSILEKNGKLPEAILKYEESLKIAQDSGNQTAIAKNFIAIGQIKTKRGEYAEAIKLFEQARILGEKLNDPRIIANALIRTSDIQQRQSQYKEALGNIQMALQIAETRNDKELMAKALNGIGNVHYFQGNFSEALDVYQRSLKYAEEWGDKTAISIAQEAIGKIYRTQGSTSEALEFYVKAQKTAEEAGDKVRLCSIFSNMGVAYKEQGLHEEAFQRYLLALSAAEELGDKQTYAQTLNNLGSLNREQGFLDRAIHYYHQALKSAEEVQNTRGIALVLNNMGDVYATQGLYEKALAYLERALKAREQIGDRWGITSTLSNIGSIYENQGKYDKALESYQRSLKIAEEAGDRPRIILVTYNLGRTYDRKGLYSESEQYFQRSLQVAKEIDSRKGMGYALEGLGATYLKIQKFQQAEEALLQARTFGEEIKEPTIIWESSYSLGKVYERQGAIQNALASYRLATDQIERIRSRAGLEEGKAGFLANKLIVYEDLIRLLHRLHKENRGQDYETKAFEYSEKAKARAFLDSFAETRIRKGLTKEQAVAEARLLRKISRIQSELWKEKITEQKRNETLRKLQEAEEELDQFLLDLRLSNPKYADLQYPKPYGLDRIRKELDSDTALLEFFVGEEESFVFAITQKEFRMALLPKKKELKQRVEKYKAAISRPPVSSRSGNAESTHREYQDLARALFLELLSPVQKTIRSKKSWIVIPDSVLHYVPLETLITERDELLLKRYQFSYAPSATIWANLRTNQGTENRSRTQLLAFADPELLSDSSNQERSLSQLRRLKYARLEVEGISALYPQTASTLYFGEQATEANFKKEPILQYKIIHLATHAVVDEEFPRRSGIILSQTKEAEEDGILQMHEIVNLNLNADLVVLSACETGLGKLVGGEGIVGLMRAFLYAGTKDVVVTLWNVDDKSTADLMKRFYVHMKSGKSKTESLRQAKLEFIRSAESGSGYAAYSNPYYWGPFELVGSGN
ncbi:CHAT domain-containing protein [bacterium]|nr:CHAT domain-containing protein [bacterium]